jgi:hypothetical protein
MLIRQRGEAWDSPFVVVYEPFDATEGATVNAVESVPVEQAGAVVLKVSSHAGATGDRCETWLMHAVDPAETLPLPEGAFKGRFGGVMRRGGDTAELYLGDGRELAQAECSLGTASEEDVAASLRCVDGQWHYAASGPVHVRLSLPPRPRDLPRLRLYRVTDGQSRLVEHHAIAPDPNSGRLLVTAALPPGKGRLTVL